MQPIQEQNDYSTVVIADDHAMVRQGTAQVLEQLKGVKLVAQADNGIEAIALVKMHKPTLLILDAAMPMARGIEVYTEARRWSPKTRIVLQTGFTSAGLLSDWLDAGIDGLILKTSECDEARLAFETVLNGGTYVATAVRELLDGAAKDISPTSRERQVLALIAAGNNNRSIADKMNISIKTVEKHRSSLMAKLNVHSVAELMVYALREGLLDEFKQL